MTGVQLIGKKAVLTRFETFSTDTWALYQGKQFIVGGIGADSLDGWLSELEATGSTATYMLRVYDSDEPPTSSTGNSDYIACIGFKVIDQYEGYGIGGHSSKLIERIGALERQLEEKEDTESNDLNEIIMGWLNDPIKLNQVAGAVRTIFGAGPSHQALPDVSAAQAVSGVGDSTEDPVARIAAALDKLEKKDPKLIEHLEKLAKLAESDPFIFKGVIAKLDAL